MEHVENKFDTHTNIVSIHFMTEPKAETKTANLVAALPLVENPHLIKVRTISPKIVDQMPKLSFQYEKDFGGDLEIIGLSKGYLVIAKQGEKLVQIHQVDFSMWLESKGHDIFEANKMISALPQIFEV